HSPCSGTSSLTLTRSVLTSPVDFQTEFLLGLASTGNHLYSHHSPFHFLYWTFTTRYSYSAGCASWVTPHCLNCLSVWASSSTSGEPGSVITSRLYWCSK